MEVVEEQVPQDGMDPLGLREDKAPLVQLGPLVGTEPQGPQAGVAGLVELELLELVVTLAQLDLLDPEEVTEPEVS